MQVLLRPDFTATLPGSSFVCANREQSAKICPVLLESGM